MKVRRTTAELGIDVGDVFVESWGYDQTNIDMYEVVATTTHTVKLRPIAGVRRDVGSGCTRVGPDRGNFIGEKVITKRPYAYESNGHVDFGLTMTSYSVARKMEDSERTYHETSQGWGH